jgi:hypothetical protein
MDWINKTQKAHISILSNAHGAWPMLWPVLKDRFMIILATTGLNLI